MNEIKHFFYFFYKAQNLMLINNKIQIKYNKE